MLHLLSAVAIDQANDGPTLTYQHLVDQPSTCDENQLQLLPKQDVPNVVRVHRQDRQLGLPQHVLESDQSLAMAGCS